MTKPLTKTELNLLIAILPMLERIANALEKFVLNAMPNAAVLQIVKL